jgi:uncharacterized protein (DUF58 family)
LHSQTEPPFFDSVFLAKLEQLSLLCRKLFKSENRADRPSRQNGSSLEFADYRNYVPGDDPRSVDWSIYARLERLVVKLYEQEQDLPIHILVDSSTSMRWTPEPERAPPEKLTAARRIAAALAYIGLSNQDRVHLSWFAHGHGPELAPGRSKGQFHKILGFLSQPPPESPTSLLTALRQFTLKTRKRGVAILITDLLDPAGFQEPLCLLNAAQFETEILQILHPAELHPELLGELQLVDSESGAELAFTATPDALGRYQELLGDLLEQQHRFCIEHRIGLVRLSSQTPFEDAVLKLLREGRFLK